MAASELCRFVTLAPWHACRFPVVVAVHFWLLSEAVERYALQEPDVGAAVDSLHKERVKMRDVAAEGDGTSALLLGRLQEATLEHVRVGFSCLPKKEAASASAPHSIAKGMYWLRSQQRSTRHHAFLQAIESNHNVTLALALQRHEVRQRVLQQLESESPADSTVISGWLDPELLLARHAGDGHHLVQLDTAPAAALKDGHLLIRPRRDARSATRDDLLFCPWQLEQVPGQEYREDTPNALMCALEVKSVLRALVPTGAAPWETAASPEPDPAPGIVGAGVDAAGPLVGDGGQVDAAPQVAAAAVVEAAGAAMGAEAVAGDVGAEGAAGAEGGAGAGVAAQQVEGHHDVRFAVGTLHELEVVQGKGLEGEYKQGPTAAGDAGGDPRVWPTLLRKAAVGLDGGAPSYPYAMLLEQGEGPMVSTKNMQYLMPVIKSVNYA